MTRQPSRSVRRSLGLLMLAASFLAAACVAVAVIIYEATTFRPRVVERLHSQTEVLAESLIPSLDFADQDTAHRYLRTILAAQPELDVAAVYDRTGQLFASELRSSTDSTPAVAEAPRVTFDSRQATWWSSISRGDESFGWLHLRQRLPPLYARLPQYGIMAGAVALGLSIFGVVMLARVGRTVLEPLAGLAGTTSYVAENDDYLVRVPVGRDDEIGQLARAFNHMLDVVGRREHALRESEERLRRLASATFEAIVFSSAGRILEVNQQAARMFGYQPSEVVGRSLLEFATPRSRLVIQEGIQARSLKDVYELELLRKDGTVCLVEGRVQDLSYGGQPARVSVLRDVTERRRAVEELARSEEKFSKAFRASPTAMLITRLHDGAILDVNAAFERLSGYRREEVLQDPTADLLRWVEADVRARVFAQIAESGSLRDLDVNLRPRDGAIRPCQLSAERVMIGSEPCILMTIIDLTEMLSAEAERAKLEGQLHQAWKLEAVGRLAGGVAHDFNNMLTVILGHAELALSAPEVSERLRTNLSEIRRAGQHSADLTRQLLAFARRQAVLPRILNLNDSVTGLLGMLRRLVGSSIHLRWLREPKLWLVKADPTHVEQVLVNLCVNARDAIGGGVGEVTIESRNMTFDEAHCARYPDHRPGSFVMLAVSDTGPGIPDDVLPQLFEPFFTTKHVSRGTGLGLATVHGIVQQHGGFLSVESRPGQGAVFRVYLPRAEAKIASPTTTTETAPSRGQGERVLLVEDEPAILEMTRQMLENLGYVVVPTGSPREALAEVRRDSRPIDLLVSDIVMPEMNGQELARQLTELRPGLRCLFISGYFANVLANQAPDQNIVLLRKPFSAHELAAKVRDALEGTVERT